MMTRRDFVRAVSWLGAAARARTIDARAIPPAEILIMRHAEEDLDRPSVHLNARGYQRAGAISNLFPARFQTPAFLFAAKDSRQSHRCTETLEPLARRLNRGLDVRFGDQDYAS